MTKKKGKKGPTSDPRSPLDEFKPEKMDFTLQLPIPGLIYPLSQANNKKIRKIFEDNNHYPV